MILVACFYYKYFAWKKFYDLNCCMFKNIENTVIYPTETSDVLQLQHQARWFRPQLVARAWPAQHFNAVVEVHHQQQLPVQVNWDQPDWGHNWIPPDVGDQRTSMTNSRIKNLTCGQPFFWTVDRLFPKVRVCQFFFLGCRQYLSAVDSLIM